jgi:hypothetical protein
MVQVYQVPTWGTQKRLGSTNKDWANGLKVALTIQGGPNLVHEAFNVGDIVSPVSRVNARYLRLIKVDKGLKNIIELNFVEVHSILLPDHDPSISGQAELDTKK